LQKLTDLLEKMDVKLDLEEEDIFLPKIKFKKKQNEVLISFKSNSILSESDREAIENTFINYLDEYKLYFKYYAKNRFKTEEELIISEIMKYNPSSKSWIGDITIDIKKEEKLIDIYIPISEIYYSLTKNGFVKSLEESLKVFDNYKVNLIEVEEDSKSADEFIENIDKEEEIFHEKQLEIIKTEKEVEKPELLDSYSFGRKNISEITQLSDMDLNSQRITVEVDIFDMEVRELKNKNFLASLSITDYTSSTLAKIFLKPDKVEEFTLNIKKNDHVVITGDVSYDNYSKCETIMIRYIEKAKKHLREDNAKDKRVELRVHSKMSQMSGVTPFDSFASTAKRWGKDTIAITDTSDVQGFPDAMDASKKYDMKILYGCDLNFVDDREKMVTNYDTETNYNSFVVFDIETTGLSSINDKITEIGAVKVVDGIIVDRFSQLVNPEKEIPEVVAELTGISNEFVRDEPTIETVIQDFYKFIHGSVLVAHNAKFDISFIRRELNSNGLEFNFPILDTLVMSRALMPELKRFNLGTLCKNLGISLVGAHRAVNDAEATAELFIKLSDRLHKDNKFSFDEWNEACANIDTKRLFENSVLVFAKNVDGLKNLYKLVSKSHMDYFYMMAKTPRSLIDEFREGLLVGSGTSESELFDAIYRNSPHDEVVEIAKYYDFLEIQPALDNLIDINSGKFSIEDIRNINKKIVEIGDELGILVVADSNTFYLDEADDISRRIVLNGKPGRPNPRNLKRQKLYFKTTEEMLKEFSYLGEEKAYEVVVKNTNTLADKIDKMDPIPEGKYPPVIEGSDEDLKNMTYHKAREIYGDPLPEIVEKRLDKELNSIINNGYAVLYIIAQKLVKKSNDDGFLVGSRGSVGSSFVATMADITEVNPLPPHYVCPNCKYSEFMDGLEYGSGIDMPDKNCPHCNTPLKKDGHNIPFEVFLGFYGDKEPDIDLNFAGEYQPNAHKYTEELFGEGYVFRAGTIGTIAEKTAYGYVLKYFEDKNISPIEVDRLAKTITGVKRTSGQHPGGVMIVPKSNSIFDFTPIQYPADDPSSGVITTHFDYNFIHGKILKLDILGHDGPSIIKMLEDFTGINSSEIRLDDPEVLKLFSSVEPLNVDKNIFEADTGTLGIPEFGTSFVIGMLKETLPKSFADLVRISGLSHGTDVWLSNAQELVNSNRAELREVIATREDIMIYLINAGAENKMAFDTMERVRKGKGLTEEQESIMKTLDLPEWYIDSCKKIKYMFPKAHAVAYVMLSFRIAYFKLNYPLAFYATHFTIKLNDFNGEIILKGPKAVKAKIEEIDSQENLTAKDKGERAVLRVALEMYSRGFEFLKPDIYKSKASKFTIEDGKIRMPFRAISGVGENCAIKIEDEASKDKFLSIEDFSKRTGAGKSVITILKNNGILTNLDETNQISLFNL
jgi:DNA polymerase-3 subunit alpha (Gram-positive type)